MKNKGLLKSKRFTIRLTPIENNLLRKNARQSKTSISNYMINCCKEVAGKSKSRVKNLSKEDERALEYVCANFYDNVNQCYHDYSNALDNLEHDNSLYNHDEIPMIDGSTIREALSAVKSNQEQLRNMRDELNQIEMSLYDN